MLMKQLPYNGAIIQIHTHEHIDHEKEKEERKKEKKNVSLDFEMIFTDIKMIPVSHIVSNSKTFESRFIRDCTKTKVPLFIWCKSGIVCLFSSINFINSGI